MKTKTVYRSLRTDVSRVSSARKSGGNVASGFGAIFTKLLFAEASLKQSTMKRATR